VNDPTPSATMLSMNALVTRESPRPVITTRQACRRAKVPHQRLTCLGHVPNRWAADRPKAMEQLASG
jgi:hypothetical protein